MSQSLVRPASRDESGTAQFIHMGQTVVQSYAGGALGERGGGRRKEESRDSFKAAVRYCDLYAGSFKAVSGSWKRGRSLNLWVLQLTIRAEAESMCDGPAS